ncbi:hypothetical protein GQ43DRAFT_407586 [Delitschia confertaspora ATCC 74209]|uniref:Uncharacterized protein n=1 Tax=Delitschia confertaspora ATCC 74209 TaxID=1513339 RepID=A0A9P4JTN0_9PLEO|nr:hypothetical protein GQ43DRAFT_407586 [Delitschia confertaspora ATCC 74209]
MNTIAPPPKISSLPPRRRVLAITIGFIGGMLGNLSLGYTGFSLYAKNTKFVPYDTSSPDLDTPVFRKHNPERNPPVCIDHAVRTVPLDKLKSQERGVLTREFCRGVWGGVGFALQRRYLERKYRALEGRDKMLWDKEELGKSEYEVGTKIVDHFEVVDRSDDRVVVRCGDSPLNTAQRPGDGLFSMEVTEDEEAQTATFHLKSVFVDTTPEGKNAQPLPWHFQFLHRAYTKLLMETAVRKLMK